MTMLATARSLHLPLGVAVTVAAVAGLFVGSFLNVVIYRVPRHLSVSRPRSFCPTCQRQLTWWENVPVVSWLALRRRCHVCHQPISARYPAVEAATALVFALVTLAWRGSPIAIGYCLLGATVLAVLVIDAGPLRAPLAVAGVGTLLGDAALVAAGAWEGRWSVVAGAQVGLAVGAVGLGALRHLDPECERRAGFGRTALLPAGCWVGGLGLLAAAVGAVTAAAVFGLALAVSRRRAAGDRAGGGAGGAAGGGAAVRCARRLTELPLLLAVASGVALSLAVFA